MDVSDEDSRNATVQLNVVRPDNRQFPLPGIDSNACSNGHLTCPLKKGEKYTFKYSLTIPEQHPTVSLF